MEDNNDVHEWEFLPDEGFLQIHDDHHTVNKIFSSRYSPYNNHLFVTNYFVFPSVRSSLNLPDPKQIHLQSPSDQISLLELELEQPDDDDDDEEIVSDHVSFKKLIAKESEFADMKLDSPKMMRTVLPQIDLGALIQYELDEASSEIHTNKDDDHHPKNSNNWRRNLTGIGAICSFGVVAAAATFCFIILGIKRKNNRGGGYSKLQFKIFSDDNKEHHKNSISMPVSVTRAHISFNLEC
ncbi:uncharacterized protein LOC124935907 [Impatiens glandulifera]|uniref:uncharacterized protein LOC124935907 n=1 Tax=Impatiens glandulifera TaxID=253017 RepID=UPI001FB054D7|nr:uncharacterized protein LOC124935907 [Impatiens glandulifera]